MLLRYACLAAVGGAYLVFVLCTGLGIPCPIHALTGLSCPGCGLSRMLVALVKGDPLSAFGYNPFLFVTGPPLLLYLAVSEVRYIRTGSGRMGGWELLLLVELILALALGILRNVLP